MDTVFALLDELPGKIAMHKITTPYVIRCLPNNIKDCGGISGFVMIAESHISIHTFPAKQYLTMDLYSCNMFDEKKVLSIVKSAFGYRVLEKHIIKRGLKFPKENLL
ncbi:MAG: S-adenosylmethionine decarboxylase, partial [Nanoarchaeota archaeon]|nr:S-adenosylmethionine decarboxylase [Nanoarchaeota archaeon]